MVAYTNIVDIRTKVTLGTFTWNPKGNKKRGHKLGGFTVHVNDTNLASIEKTTRSKAELLIKNVYRAQSVKGIKTERDLEILVNSFVETHNPYILFNGDKTFNASHDYNTTFEEFKNELASKDMKALTKGYFKRKVRKDMKEFIKTHRK